MAQQENLALAAGVHAARKPVFGCCSTSAAHGSVLILALWTLFFLGALALAVGSYVSASVNMAGRLKGDMIAHQLARAGVELAIGEVAGNVTNWNASTEDGFRSNPSLFKDNGSLPGGTFSVSYTYLSTNAGQTVTNYGIAREKRKVNVNTASAGALATLLQEKGSLDEGSATTLATNIVRWRTGTREGGKNKLAGSGSAEYVSTGFQSLYELLLVDGMAGDLFVEIEPSMTVFGKNCYGAVSEGIASVSNGEGGRNVIGSRVIVFVYDRDRRRLVYWHEL